MRKLVLQEFISLDGLVAGPNGSVDFIPAAMQGDRHFGKDQVALMDATDTLVLGRATYEMFSGYWPHVTEGEEQAFADKFNALRKIVFSKTLKRAPWGKWGDARIVRDNIVDEVARLKRQPGKNVLVSGSVSIARSLIDHGLIDEYRLVVCPVVLGKGLPLFRDGMQSISMNLVDVHALDRGAVSAIYARGSSVG